FPAIFTQSNRGARIIVISGFKFVRQQRLGMKTRWFCGSHSKYGCKAHLYLNDDNEIITCNNNHSHEPPAVLGSQSAGSNLAPEDAVERTDDIRRIAGSRWIQAAEDREILVMRTALGNPMLNIGGYKFYKHCESGNGTKIRWLCEIEITRTSLGTPMLTQGSHKFYIQNQTAKGAKIRWLCGKKRCKAFFLTSITDAEPSFDTSSKGGTVIVLNGYRFSIHRVVGYKTRWHCASHKSRGCKAYIYTIDREIVKCVNEHYHEKPKKVFNNRDDDSSKSKLEYAAQRHYDEPWEGVNHIIVTPDLPVPVQALDMKYLPQGIIKTEEQKPKLCRTRAVKRPDTPEPLDSCGCNHNCVDKLNGEAQKELFNEFWSLRDRQIQRDYLVDRVKFEEPKKSLVNDSRKKFSLTYTFVYRNHEYNVCRMVFLHTLNVTEKLIRYALLNKDRDVNLPCPEEACFNTTPRGGTVIVHEGYRFSRHHVTDSKTRWHCATHKGKGCRAYIYTVDTQIVRYSTPGAVFAIGRRGARTILLNGYKFLKQRSNGAKCRWWCGTHSGRGCKAVIFTVNDLIIRCNADHNHEPPAPGSLPWPSQVQSGVAVSYDGSKTERF
ncbi:FLYWCH-type zinc finger-containing protein 1, partial [Maniola hyperantus]|uniref:FLYWCH-type zinc finger-containing protein 1 n=1 Tax=Aphantopus hyperantus TaxID=2795564 RepID=UPI0037496193